MRWAATGTYVAEVGAVSGGECEARQQHAQAGGGTAQHGLWGEEMRGKGRRRLQRGASAVDT